MIRHVAAMVLGAAAFASVQLVLLRRAGPPLSDSAGWFLNSDTNGLAICAAVAIAAAVVAAFASPADLFSAAVACLAGAIIAMSAVLFTIGPGTIFPIVIVFGGAVLGLAVAAGTATVAGVRQVASRLFAR